MKKIFIYLFIAGGSAGYMAQTDSWVNITPGPVLNYGAAKLIAKNNSIFVFNSNYSSLLRSTDGGISWSSLSIPSDSTRHEYNDLTFVNDQVGYVVGYDGSLFSKYGIRSVIKKTTDGGLTWQNASNGLLHQSILTHISFFNANQGIAFGTAQMKTHRFITNDGGQNWTYLPNFGPDMDQVNSSAGFSGQDGIVAGVGHYMHLAITHDEGSTWTTRHFHSLTSASGLKFFDDQNGIVVADDYIFTTHDGALTFASQIKFPYANFIKSFDMIDLQRGFFCTDHDIYYTADGGNSWSLSYSNPDLQLVSLKIEGANVFASTAGSSSILKLDISDRIVGISHQAKGSQQLELYPNPTSDRFYLGAPEGEILVSAVIFDQLGRKVKTQPLAGTKAVEVGELSPGAYLVEISSGEHTYLHKLIIQNK